MRQVLKAAAVAALAAAIASCAPTQQLAQAPQAAAKPVTPEQDVAHPGKALFDAKGCAGCHNNPEATRAPATAGLRLLRRESVEYALTVGYMRTQAKNLSAAERHQVEDWLALGQPDNSAWVARTKCKGAVAGINANAKPVAQTFGLDFHNTRNATAAATGLKKSDFAKLELAWAVGLPQTPSMRSQPVIAGKTLFIAAADAGRITAFDTDTGCAKWQFENVEPLRSSLTYAEMAPGKPVILAGDAMGYVVAVDAVTGKQVWRSDVRLHESSRITGAPVVYRDKVFAPISGTEINHAVDETYECCKSQGGVVAVNLQTGKKIWVGRTMDEAKPTQKSRVGTQMWGPSGAPIWNTPAIDEKRGLVYAGTGEQNSIPFVETTDAIIAWDINTGERKWVFQATAKDLWHYACPRGANCFGADTGITVDWDFGGSVVIAKRSDGRDILLAGQKSGDIWALDPDNGGKLIWNKRLSKGGANGGVHWGIAVEGNRLFAPMNDNAAPTSELPLSGYGLHALDVDTGNVLWTKRPVADCTGDRRQRYAQCATRMGYTPAPMVIDGAVLQGAQDGILRVYDSVTGDMLWTYDTMRKFDTVNGVPANGGAIDAAPYVAANGMLFVVSGYARFGETPGNVLLAFRPRK